MATWRRIGAAAMMAGAILLGADQASAATYTFSDAGGTISSAAGVTAEASAIFDITGTLLTVTLTNANSGASGNGSLLTGVLFSTNGAQQAFAESNPSFTTSYFLVGGSTITAFGSGGAPATTGAGTWLFAGAGATNTSFPTNPATSQPFQYGFSTTAGGGYFSNSSSPDPGDDNYGVLGSAACGYTGSTPHNCTTSSPKTPLVIGSIQFQISGFTAAAVTSVEFLYTSNGTTTGNATNTTVQATPEPASLTLFASGLAGIAALRRRRRG